MAVNKVVCVSEVASDERRMGNAILAAFMLSRVILERLLLPFGM